MAVPFRKRHLLALAVMLVGALLPTPAAAAANTVGVAAGGLDRPRSLDFLGGLAAVAESGSGNSDSGISLVDVNSGGHHQLVGGFYSLSLGLETIGISGISVRHGTIYAQIGTTSRELPPGFPLATQAGHLIAVNPATRTWRDVASVGDSDFDYTTQFTPPDPAFFGNPNASPPVPPDPSKYNPNAQEHDANPTGVLATAGGWLVADSGANTLTKVDRHGRITVLHHWIINNPIPRSFPSDAVPTCVARTDEATWVGMLNGMLFKLEDGKATQVVPRDASGKALLTHVTGCSTGRNGTLFLVNMFGGGPPFATPEFFNSSVVQYKPDENRGAKLADAVGNPALYLAYWPAVGPDGNLYVTSGTLCDRAGSPLPVFPPSFNPCAGGGKVVRISLPNSEDN